MITGFVKCQDGVAHDGENSPENTDHEEEQTRQDNADLQPKNVNEGHGDRKNTKFKRLHTKVHTRQP